MFCQLCYECSFNSGPLVTCRLQWKARDQQETIVAEQTVRDQVCSEVAKTIAWLQQTKATQVLPPAMGLSVDDVRQHLEKQKVGGMEHRWLILSG